MYTHSKVNYRIAGGKTRTRNIRVYNEGDLTDPKVKQEVVDVIASTHRVTANQVSLVTGKPPKPRQLPKASDIRKLTKSELIELISKTTELDGIDTDGTVKSMQEAIIDRLQLVD